MGERTWGIGRNGNVRERTRGIVILVVAFIGLVAEGISTIQDGIGGPKVIALACFAFMFWYGWELAHRAKPQDRRPQ